MSILLFIISLAKKKCLFVLFELEKNRLKMSCLSGRKNKPGKNYHNLLVKLIKELSG